MKRGTSRRQERKQMQEKAKASEINKMCRGTPTKAHMRQMLRTPTAPPRTRPRSYTTHRCPRGARRQADTLQTCCRIRNLYGYHGGGWGHIPRQWPSSGGPWRQLLWGGLPPSFLATLGTLSMASGVSVSSAFVRSCVHGRRIGHPGHARGGSRWTPRRAAVAGGWRPADSCGLFFRVLSCTTCAVRQVLQSG